MKSKNFTLIVDLIDKVLSENVVDKSSEVASAVSSIENIFNISEKQKEKLEDILSKLSLKDVKKAIIVSRPDLRHYVAVSPKSKPIKQG